MSANLKWLNIWDYSSCLVLVPLGKCWLLYYVKTFALKTVIWVWCLREWNIEWAWKEWICSERRLVWRLSRGGKRSDHKVSCAIERLFCQGELKMFWSQIISQFSLSNYMTESKLKFGSPVTSLNHVFISLLVDAVLKIILTLKYFKKSQKCI